MVTIETCIIEARLLISEFPIPRLQAHKLAAGSIGTVSGKYRVLQILGPNKLAVLPSRAKDRIIIEGDLDERIRR